MQDLPQRIEPTPRPGSVSHYCLFFTPGRHRADSLALYALCRNLDVARDASDPGVARIKLEWWREELLRAAASAARHPITGHLAASLGNRSADLVALVEHRERELSHRNLVTETAFEEWALQGPGTALTAWARLLADDGESAWNSSLRSLALALQRIDVLNRSHHAAWRGSAQHPSERLERFNVAPSALAHSRPTSALRNLVDAQIGFACRELDAALDRWPRPYRKHHAPLVVLANLRRRTLLERRKSPWEHTNDRVVLTPLRKLWFGWRRTKRERQS